MWHMNKKEVYWDPWLMDFIDNLMLKHLESAKNKMRLVDLFMALSFVIAIGSVLWQIVSVARVNPVWALKKE